MDKFNPTLNLDMQKQKTLNGTDCIEHKQGIMHRIEAWHKIKTLQFI